MKGWFVLQTKVRSEERVEFHLKQDYRVFVPKISRDRKKDPTEKIEPLFPGYAFVYMPEDTDWHVPIKTPGVIKFVNFGGSPAPLPDVIIHQLWADEAIRYTNPEPTDYKPGEAVRIKSGPFQNIKGIIDKPQGERVRILLDVLGQERPATVDRRDIEVLD